MMTSSRIMAALTAGIITIFLFCSCGEMDFTLPSNRNYQMSARGEVYSLDEYAIIKKDEKIQPFFVSPINGDPDVGSLRVSIISPVERKPEATVRYVLTSLRENDESEEEPTIIWERIDEALPVFSIPEDLKAGPYILVFQVFGKNQLLLSKNEKNIYYIAEEDFNLTDFGAYLPGLFISTTTSHLIPPETVILLEAGITEGRALDSYIVWYNGKTILGEGKVSEGANSILWKVPSQVGFQSIRAEVVPFPPIFVNYDSASSSKSDRILSGKVREISLPISGKKESSGAASEPLAMMELGSVHGEVLWNYHPAKELDDPQNPFPKNTLLAWKPDPDENGLLPNWIPAQEGFGLGIGPDNVYHLSSFPIEPGNILSFIFRLVSLNDGNHFSVIFDPTGPEIIFTREEDSFVLILNVDNEEERIPVEIPFRADFNTLFLDLTFSEDAFSLSLKEDGETAPKVEKTFSPWNPEGVQGTLQLGGWSSQTQPVMILGEFCVISSPAEPLVTSISPGEEVLVSQAP